MLRRLALPALVVLVAACAGGDDGGPDSLSLTGSWRQSADLRSATDTLIPIGNFQFVQSGETFSGTGQQFPGCVASETSHDSPMASEEPFEITNGTLVGRVVTFQRDVCEYTGSFVEGRNDRITGTATCTYRQDDIDYVFTGQWQATKN